MAMLTYDGFMIPVLRQLSDGASHKVRDLVHDVADATGLTEEERAIVLQSGQQLYRNRINWATSYLFKYGMINRPHRATYAINDLGRQLLDQSGPHITTKELIAFASAQGIAPEVPTRGPRSAPAESAPEPAIFDPEASYFDPVEQIETGIQRLHSSVADELLARLHANDPAFFEQAVLDLLMAMGYGGTEGRANRTQLSNDGGIDGVIDQDALGLSRVYVQAKRYAVENTIGRPAIQGFVGALQGAQASQGVFLTTGRFSNGAEEYAETIQTRVVLVDGERLARLMIRYGVGVQVERSFAIVKVDEDFFE